MADIIYWENYKEPKKVYDPVMKVDREINGKWVCKDPRVEWFSLFGYLKSNSEQMGIKAELLLKNGDRKSFVAKEVHN